MGCSLIAAQADSTWMAMGMHCNDAKDRQEARTCSRRPCKHTHSHSAVTSADSRVHHKVSWPIHEGAHKLLQACIWAANVLIQAAADWQSESPSMLSVLCCSFQIWHLVLPVTGVELQQPASASALILI